VPLLDEGKPATAEASDAVKKLIAEIKAMLGDRVQDVRASDRLTESPVCLVAAESGMDRELERILARAGQLSAAGKPVVEINPRHDLIEALAALDVREPVTGSDIAHLLYDEARILDGEPPEDPKAFSERLTRVMRKAYAAKS
jgi:molecular chaperone HtpG